VHRLDRLHDSQLLLNIRHMAGHVMVTV